MAPGYALMNWDRCKPFLEAGNNGGDERRADLSARAVNRERINFSPLFVLIPGRRWGEGLPVKIVKTVARFSKKSF
jgi:hypothetical protein